MKTSTLKKHLFNFSHFLETNGYENMYQDINNDGRTWSTADDEINGTGRKYTIDEIFKEYKCSDEWYDALDDVDENKKTLPNICIHELKLHESTFIDSYEVKRVPGGWLYVNVILNEVNFFVPYSKEFKPLKKSEITLPDFIKNNKDITPARLINEVESDIMRNKWRNEKRDMKLKAYVEEIFMDDLKLRQKILKLRNIGKKTVDEFLKAVESINQKP